MRSLRCIPKVGSKNISRITVSLGLLLVRLRGFYESPYCWAIVCKANSVVFSVAGQYTPAPRIMCNVWGYHRRALGALGNYVQERTNT